ncbi:MAG: hypothetical protein NTU57_03340 [Candidatus Aenigmarchaeota archaeon]|nr:hypothetical protein [Candidatus Aenigmarchaeota archaeon]
MKKLTTLSLILGLVLISGCIYDQHTSENEQKQFVGIIEVDPPKSYNLGGCGYCFTSDDGAFNCSLLGDMNDTGHLYAAKNLDEYVGKRVILYGKKHEGPAIIMCPVQIDVEKIEIIE